ncbi:uncharacterized protein Z520_10946 [Fonsecaea multimorphosa CBS 102226]|uniref:Uncharacterized protein n=1 Tax=Fonsecaea multimorphosa CBS 102226 TaxID=1442371 RepID=A0A0D2KA64_9EURO|nr:uncharacterized protein Z520_10946 [Fonsecaea multimorphosa CBS 102226]KIX93303.1 hypothetical protein Z520_10946 [Fonsecaea multimorphosa CBS 102226]
MDDDDVEDEPGTKLPAAEDQIEAPSKDISAIEESSSPVEGLVTQAYMQKGVFFLLIMLVVVVIVKRRRTPSQKLDDKSMA